jgi:adenylate cyclase
MALEIERRFLVRDDAWRAHVEWEAELRQGYLLSREDGLTARIRLQRQGNGESQAWFTIKAPSELDATPQARQEFEYTIPVEDAQALLRLAPWQLSKRRHGLNLPGGEWVLDVFEAENAPLVIAEVELQHPDDSPSIPSWCGREITGLHQFSNAALAKSPLRHWPEADTRLLF